MSQIELYQIRKEYPNGEMPVVALNQISLSFENGEFASIIGSSGSGKSTLLNILGCLDLPTSGEYYLNGMSVHKMSQRTLSNIRNCTIGFIFQSFHLINTLTALENVELPLIYQKIPKQKRRLLAVDALEQVGLSARKHHPPSKMSGGQQQRVAIARAIATHPPILLADEPTGNLDTSSSKDIMSILYHLNQSGRTVLLITHDPSIAEQTNRNIEIRDGNLVLDQKIEHSFQKTS